MSDPPSTDQGPGSQEEALSHQVSGQSNVEPSDEELQQVDLQGQPFVEHDSDASSIGEEAEAERETRTVGRCPFSTTDVETLEESDFPDLHEDLQKTPEEAERIMTCIQDVALFKGYDELELRLVADHMYRLLVVSGQVVIRCGGIGDAFYVVKSGSFRCTAPVSGGVEEVLCTYDGRGFFGELALINRAPRAATITAITDGELWVLSALRCSWLRKHRAMLNADRLEKVLKAIPLLESNLDSSLINRLIDALEVVDFSPGDVICSQGDPGDAMYFILEGEVQAEINGNPVKTLGKGEFFGERALILDEGRAATCLATARCKLAKLPQESFRLLIPDSVVDKMKLRITGSYDNSSSEDDVSVCIEYSCQETKK